MRPNQPRGSIIGRNQRRSTLPRYTYTYALHAHTYVCAGVAGVWPGFCSRQISLPLSLSISLLPSIPLFPSFFPFLFSPLSLSPSLSIVIPATSPARYFIIISSLSRLAGFPANDAFPCNDWNPGRGCITHAKITFPTSGNTRRFRNLVSTNTWTIGVRRILRSYEEIVSRECDPDPGREEGSIIFERDGAWTVGSGKVVRRAATAAGEGRSFPETRRRRGGGGDERERGVY